MKCILYIPPFGVEGTNVSNIAMVQVGGLTLYSRACRCIQVADFDEIIVVKPESLDCKPDSLIKIPVKFFSYVERVRECSDKIREVVEGETDICVCQLDGMLGPKCFKMRPKGADVRIIANGEESGVFFMSLRTLNTLLDSEVSLDDIAGAVSETFVSPESTVYHRVVSADDLKICQNVLTKSLKKPLGRDADGLVAYFINRPCSLRISKHLANTFVTPNMVSAFGLLLGLVAAGLVFTGITFYMVIAVILWQIASMVDGIDGELARMRMNPSHRGEWFDTVADDITNIAFLFGLGHGISQSTISGNPLFFYISSGVCVLMVIVVGWFYREFVKLGIASHNHFEWGFETENRENKSAEHRNIIRRALDKIAGGFAWVAKRDFYTFLIMCLVIIGYLSKIDAFYYAAFFIMLTGATFVGVGGLIALTIRAFRGKRSKST